MTTKSTMIEVLEAVVTLVTWKRHGHRERDLRDKISLRVNLPPTLSGEENKTGETWVHIDADQGTAEQWVINNLGMTPRVKYKSGPE